MERGCRDHQPLLRSERRFSNALALECEPRESSHNQANGHGQSEHGRDERQRDVFREVGGLDAALGLCDRREPRCYGA